MSPSARGLGPERPFLAFVTHDMRDPLNAVLGMARLLAETPLDDEQKGYVAAIEDAAETLLTLVNDLLDLSRLEAGRLELGSVDFDLPAFLDSLVTMLRPAAGSRGLRLEYRLDPRAPVRLRGDPARLRQVLLNLAGNAVKYADRGTVRLEVRAQQEGDAAARLRFRITDEGPGMSAEMLERLFEPWARGVDEASPGPAGSGLGMLLARRMVERMGGTLGVVSAPGRGTCFDVGITFALGDRRPDEDPPATLRGLRVLLVDPHRRSRIRNAGLLRGLGIDVRIAGDAAEALAALEAGSPLPDVVVVDRDAETAALDGDGFAGRLRRLPGGENTRLVLLSAAGLRGDAERAREAGYDAFLAKPARAGELEACLLALAPGRPASLVTRHELDRQAAPLTVLVADDNPTNLRLLAILLGRLGHRVLEAADGHEALEQFERFAVDAVLLDVRMPGLDGLQTVARIRSHPDPRKAATPVIAVTANALPEDIERYLAAGMDDCLAKPIDRVALSQLLGRCRRSG